jgi:hypothetical protein
MMKKLMMTKLQPRFIELVERYIRMTPDMSQSKLAQIVKIHRPRLVALLNPQTNPDVFLSAHYIYPFIREGIFSVDDIRQGKKSESSRETEFWDLASETENIATLRKIVKAKKLGINVDQNLDEAIEAIEKLSGKK